MSITRFPRRCRLSQANEFRRVFADPCKSAGPCFTILAIPNGLAHARLGLAISKKNVKAATSRNRVKRVVRESFRRHQDRLSGLDVVVIARRGVDVNSNQDLFGALDKQWPYLAKRCKTC